MKYIQPSALKNAVFFTDADRVQQNIYNLDIKTIENKVKLVTLLSDKIVIPTSHIFESKLSSKIFLKTPELIENGVFIPSLPASYDSFAEYLNGKRKEFSYGFNYSTTELDKIAEFLESYSRNVIWRDDLEVRKYHKDSLIRDLKNPTSLLSHRLGKWETSRTSFVKKIQDSQASRDAFLLLADQLPTRQKEVFIEHVQSLYLLAGGKGNNAYPIVHPNQTSIYKDKFARVLGAYDPALFSLVTRGIGLREDMLSVLSIENVLELREQIAIKQFRRKYFRLIDEAMQGLLTLNKS